MTPQGLSHVYANQENFMLGLLALTAVLAHIAVLMEPVHALPVLLEIIPMHKVSAHA